MNVFYLEMEGEDFTYSGLSFLKFFIFMYLLIYFFPPERCVPTHPLSRLSWLVLSGAPYSSAFPSDACVLQGERLSFFFFSFFFWWFHTCV
jgi:hypothetical protein